MLNVAILATVAWGVLAFGAVYPWAYWPLAGAAVITGALGWMAARKTPWAERGLALPLLLVAIGAALQMVPLPRQALELISPATLQYLDAYDLRWAYRIGVSAQSHALSLDPERTLLGIALLAAFSMLLLGTARALSRTGPSNLAVGLIVLGTCVALIAIVQGALTADQLAYDVKIYGFWTPQNRATPYGPFVNRNHFAGFVVMLLPLALAYLAALVDDALRHVRPTLRDRMLWTGTPAGGRAWLIAMCAAVMMLSLLLSRSRSGLAAFAGAVGIAALIGAGGSRRWRRVLPAVILLGALAGARVIWAGADTGLSRVGEVSTEIGGRLSAWRDATRIVKAFPIFGTGLNTYGAASLLYQSTSLESHYREAHNEYLQLAAEGGLWLGVPILLCCWQLARLTRARFRAPHASREHYWLRVGAVTALLAIALQSLVEFSLQMPGNAALFAVVAAIAVHAGRDKTTGLTGEAESPRPVRGSR